MKVPYTIRMIGVGTIQPDAFGRKLDPKTVDALARSIKTFGMLNPITVLDHQKVSLGGTFGDGYRILAGNHRFAAALKDCLDEVPCIVMDDGEALLAELATVEENATRCDLTVVEKSIAYGRRKEIYDAIAAAKKNGTPLPQMLDTHVWERPIGGKPDGNKAANGQPSVETETEPLLKLEVAQAAPLQVSGFVHNPATGPRQHGGARPHDPGFGVVAGNEVGENKSTANRLAKHFTDLGAEDTLRASHTSLDSHAQLTALAELPPEEREQLIERAEHGEKVSATKAAKAVKAKRKPADPRKTFFKSLASGLEGAIKRIEKATGQPLETLGGPLEELGISGEIDDAIVDRLQASVKRLRRLLAEIDEFAC
ncbi:MAG TPA: ParB N-terminal domain-containing protein [Rhodanobacteraceae bacterium]